MTERPFLGGVIEGFYGPPWSAPQRQRLFARMSAWGMNTYFYAPKDDLHHRALWREPYDAATAASLAGTIRDCTHAGLRFVYGLAPGLDIAYSDPVEIARVQARFQQLLELGCRDFALLFDDIPDRLSDADQRLHGTFARAHAAVTTALHTWIAPQCPGGRFLFCPTPYCGRMARAGLGGPDYLATIGRELSAEIDIFWTGPEIVSTAIDAPSLRELRELLRRPPLIWDNLHANDYDVRRLYLGPYSGRDPSLRAQLAGVLTNPNCEFEANFVAIHTLAQWLRADAGQPWNPRKALLAALEEWRPKFEGVRGGIPLKDLVLFADCLYLPGEDGPGATALFELAARLLRQAPGEWGESAAAFRDLTGRLLRVCERLTEVHHREIFYALHRRSWELKEELQLLLGAVDWCERHGSLDGFASDFHRPPTYRGGFTRRLESLLVPQADGSFAAGAVSPLSES